MPEMLLIVDEGTAVYLEFKLKDKAGALAVPTNLSYSVTCLTTGNVVRSSTPITAVSEGEIMLDSDDTAIQNDANAMETKVVTLQALYGAKDQLNKEYQFQVRNLHGI